MINTNTNKMNTLTSNELAKFQDIVNNLNAKNGTDFTIEDMLACMPKLDAIITKELTNTVVIKGYTYNIDNTRTRIRKGKGYTREELEKRLGSNHSLATDNGLLIINIFYDNRTFLYRAFAHGFLINKSGKFVSSCQVEGVGHYDLFEGSYYIDKQTFEQKYL
jgi:hypothetical protein